MAVKIRLSRFGKKHRPFYRIVVINSQAKAKGQYLKSLGTYNPLTNPPIIKIDKKQLFAWLNKGAQMSKTVKNLVKKLNNFELTRQ